MECRGFMGPGYYLHMEVLQIPGRTGQRLAGRACAAGPGGSVGVSLNWGEGGGSDPPDVAWSDGNVQQAHLSGVRQGGDREGVGWPWVSRAESKPAPAPSL